MEQIKTEPEEYDERYPNINDKLNETEVRNELEPFASIFCEVKTEPHVS